jgi:hypothetical protein
MRNAGKGGIVNTRKARLTARRAVNRQLAERDAANRCTHCRAPLQGVIVESFLSDGKFCSEGCLHAHEAVERMEKKA